MKYPTFRLYFLGIKIQVTFGIFNGTVYHSKALHKGYMFVLIMEGMPAPQESVSFGLGNAIFHVFQETVS